MIVQDGVITHTRDNTIISTNSVYLCSNSIPPEITSEVIQNAIIRANEAVNTLNSEYIVTDRYIKKSYDIRTGKYYYKIMSVYLTPEGAYGATVTSCELLS